MRCCRGRNDLLIRLNRVAGLSGPTAITVVSHPSIPLGATCMLIHLVLAFGSFVVLLIVALWGIRTFGHRSSADEKIT